MYNNKVKINDKINDKEEVMTNPVNSVYGMLNEYSTNQGSFTTQRNIAWEKVADEWQE